VTSPARPITVVCPHVGCGATFTGSHRASINLTLGEEWSDERLHDAFHVVCPTGHETCLDVLVVTHRGWVYNPFAIDTEEYPERPY
jgi:hypothetical protein